MLFNLDELCFDNLVGYWKSLAINSPLATANTEHIPVFTGINNPLFNPIFSKKNAESLPPKISGFSYSFWHDSKRNEKIPVAAVAGLEPIMEHLPVMSIRLDKEFKQKLSSNIIIEKLGEGNNLSDWIVPVQIAFQMGSDMAARYRQCLEKISDKFVHFIAKSDEKIVAASSLFLHDEMAGLYNLAVLPEYRKQGIGTALHYARLNEARKRGYHFATLQATPMASALDKQLGFVTHSELSIYKY